MVKIPEKKTFFTNSFFASLIAILCTALWGNMIPAINLGLNFLGVLPNDVFSQILFAGFCFTIAGILGLILPMKKQKKFIFPKKTLLLDTIILGLVQTSLQYIFLYIGIPNTCAVNASIISSSGAFLIVIMSHFVYKNDSINIQKILGCFFGLLGALALSFDSFTSFSPSFSFIGEGSIFLSTLCFVFTTPLCKKLSKFESSVIFTSHSFLIGGIFLIFTGFLGGGTLKLSHAGIFIIFYIAIIASVAGILWNYLLQYNKVSKVSIYNFLVPIFGALSASIMLGENILTFKNISSLIFTCLGLYIVELDFNFISLFKRLKGYKSS